jgi:hypothetical protein
MVTKYQKFGDGYKAEAVKLYRGCVFLRGGLFQDVPVMRRG